MAGNSYTGKVIRALMEQDMLEELKKLLPEVDDNASHMWITYFERLRELYYVIVKPEPEEDYSEVFQNYQDTFEDVHSYWGLFCARM